MGATNKPAGTAQTTAESQLVLRHAIAAVAKAIDEKILALPGSRDQLLPAIQFAIAYYEKAIATIPGPVTVSTARHGGDPKLAAMFPSAQDIIAGLGRSIAVRNSISWFVENRHERIFAVMGTRRRPGDTSAELADHTFRSLGASDRDARECLCEAAFTGLVNAFASRLKERQREWRHLHADRPAQSGGTRSPTTATPPSGGPSPRQQEIFSRHLDPAGDELTPQDGLAALIEWLRTPEAQMRIGPREGPAGDGSGHSGLLMMSSSDRRHWLVCMTEFSLQDALAAIADTPAANRYILI